MTTTPAASSPEVRLLQVCRADPSQFLEHVLGCSFYDRQIEMIEAVRDYARVAVCGANGTGKDYAAGRIIHWWQQTRYPAKTIVIGPTHRQVHDILWRECRTAFIQARVPLGGRMLPSASRWEYDDQHFAVGFATNDEFNIQGFHSPHLLVVLTEAHSMEQGQVDAVKRLNPERILMTGNPFTVTGEFYDAFHERSDLYHPVTISAFDTPNVLMGDMVIPGIVTAEQVTERAIEWGEESPLYQASVLGEFPDSLDDNLVSLVDAKAAVNRQLVVPEHEPAIFGVDVARYGGDASVVYRRQGSVARVLYRRQGVSTMDLTARLADLLEEDQAVDRIVVDSVGVGAGVVDRLREMPVSRRVAVIPFVGGAKARDHDRFANAIAECWWGMAQSFRQGNIDIEDDKRLVAQVTGRNYTEQSDRRIRLESKDEIKRRGGRSPDEADALAMTYVAPAGGIGGFFL